MPYCNQGCGIGSGSWKRKRRKQLIFCGSGSTLMKQVESGSELGSESFEKELEGKQFFQNQELLDFQPGYNRWGKM